MLEWGEVAGEVRIPTGGGGGEGKEKPALRNAKAMTIPGSLAGWDGLLLRIVRASPGAEVSLKKIHGIILSEPSGSKSMPFIAALNRVRPQITMGQLVDRGVRTRTLRWLGGSNVGLGPLGALHGGAKARAAPDRPTVSGNSTGGVAARSATARRSASTE